MPEPETCDGCGADLEGAHLECPRCIAAGCAKCFPAGVGVQCHGCDAIDDLGNEDEDLLTGEASDD